MKLIPNTKDNTHCFQACVRMAVDFPVTYKALDAIDKKEEGKWSWQGATLLWLAKQGYEVLNMENLDYKKFASKGEKYLKTIWPEEVFRLQKEMGDLKKEQAIAKDLLACPDISLVNLETDVTETLLRTLNFNYDSLLVSVNPCAFVGKDDYWSHMVIITDIDRKYVHFNDPGLPARRRKVNIDAFLKAVNKPDINLIGLTKL